MKEEGWKDGRKQIRGKEGRIEGRKKGESRNGMEYKTAITIPGGEAEAGAGAGVG